MADAEVRKILGEISAKERAQNPDDSTREDLGKLAEKVGSAFEQKKERIKQLMGYVDEVKGAFTRQQMLDFKVEQHLKEFKWLTKKLAIDNKAPLSEAVVKDLVRRISDWKLEGGVLDFALSEKIERQIVDSIKKASWSDPETESLYIFLHNPKNRIEFLKKVHAHNNKNYFFNGNIPEVFHEALGSLNSFEYAQGFFYLYRDGFIHETAESASDWAEVMNNMHTERMFMWTMNDLTKLTKDPKELLKMMDIYKEMADDWRVHQVAVSLIQSGFVRSVDQLIRIKPIVVNAKSTYASEIINNYEFISLSNVDTWAEILTSIQNDGQGTALLAAMRKLRLRDTEPVKKWLDVLQIIQNEGQGLIVKLLINEGHIKKTEEIDDFITLYESLHGEAGYRFIRYLFDDEIEAKRPTDETWGDWLKVVEHVKEIGGYEAISFLMYMKVAETPEELIKWAPMIGGIKRAENVTLFERLIEEKIITGPEKAEGLSEVLNLDHSRIENFVNYGLIKNADDLVRFKPLLELEGENVYSIMSALVPEEGATPIYEFIAMTNFRSEEDLFAMLPLFEYGKQFKSFEPVKDLLNSMSHMYWALDSKREYKAYRENPQLDIAGLTGMLNLEKYPALKHLAESDKGLFTQYMDEIKDDFLNPETQEMIVNIIHALGPHSLEFFRNDYKKFREDLHNPKLGPALLVCAKDRKDNFPKFLEETYPNFREDLLDERLNADLLALLKSTENVWGLMNFYDRFKKFFHKDEMRPHIVALSKASGGKGWKLVIESFKEGGSAYKYVTDPDTLPAIPKIIAPVADVSDKINMQPRILTSMPKYVLKNLDDPDFVSDAVRLHKLIGSNTNGLEPSTASDFWINHEDVLSKAKIRKDLIQMLENAGESALDIMGLPSGYYDRGYAALMKRKEFKDHLKDKKIRQDIIEMSGHLGVQTMSSIALLVSRNVFSIEPGKYKDFSFLEHFEEGGSRQEFMKLVKHLGKDTTTFLETFFFYDEVQQAFKEKGFEGLQKYIADYQKLVKATGRHSGRLLDAGIERGDQDSWTAAFDEFYLARGVSALEGYYTDVADMLGEDYDGSVFWNFQNYLQPMLERPDFREKMLQISKAFGDGDGFMNLVALDKEKVFAIENPETLQDYLTLIKTNKKAAVGFIDHAYDLFKQNDLIDFSDEANVSLVLSTYKKVTDSMRGINISKLLEQSFEASKFLDMHMLEYMQMIHDFQEGENKDIVDKLNAFYADGETDIALLKTTFEVLYLLGNDELQRFGAGFDVEPILKHYQNENVEIKVLVARPMIKYMQSETQKIVDALKLTSEDVANFLAMERKTPKVKLSNYFYIVQGYTMLGEEDKIGDVLKDVDFTKVMKEKMSVEVFGLLEVIEAPIEIWEAVIESFPLDIDNLSVTEGVRKKLLEISVEKANQIVEYKAKEFVEDPITSANLQRKVNFAKNWANPEEQGISSGLDDRFVMDIYRHAAAVMKNKVKAFVLENPVKGIATWELFDEDTLKEIELVQLVMKEDIRRREEELRAEVERQKAEAKKVEEEKLARQLSEQERQQEIARKNLRFLRNWALEGQDSSNISGRIRSNEDFQRRVTLFRGFKAEGLESQMGLIRDQVANFVLRSLETNKDFLSAKFAWKKEQKEVRFILSKMGIEHIESADNLQAWIKKGLTRVWTDPAYVARKAKLKLGLDSREVNYDIPYSAIEGMKLRDYSGREEQLSINQDIENDQMHPSAKLYTISRKNRIEAVVLMVDPSKGGAFDFEVQVGATTEGNKGNLTELLQKKHGNNLMMDTVGAMVHGAGMPISMIFEDGEPKNKKTTMEGQRDGLVVFNTESGQMAIINKNEILYSDMNKVMNLARFERSLLKEMVDLEAELMKLADVEELSKEALDAIKTSDPKLVQRYRKVTLLNEAFSDWKSGKPLNYASQETYLDQELFWKMAEFSNLSGFIESLYVEGGESQVKAEGGRAHKRLLLEFSDGSYGIYDSRIDMSDREASLKIEDLVLDGKVPIKAVNLDTGMADDTRVYNKVGKGFQMGHTSQPVGTNRIGIYHKP